MLEKAKDQPAADETSRGALDALMPSSMAARAEEIGVRKIATDRLSLLVLSVLAGAFISFGAIFATTVGADGALLPAAQASARPAVSLPYGVVRLLSGLAFSLGLILVVVGGAELFTGNNLIVMAWASRRVRTRDLLRNWAIAFVGNAAGAGATAVLMVLTGQYMFGGGAVGLSALNIAAGKVALGPASAFSLGIMCNALVCLAVWMSYSARTTADRILCVVPPVAAFVAAGFEHSIANIYFLAVALLIKALAPPSFWTAIGRQPGDFDGITWTSSCLDNLVPVTAGNIVGGAVLVAGVYWFIYLRKRSPASAGRS